MILIKYEFKLINYLINPVFQITRQSDYALRLLVELKNQKGEILPLKKFAEKQDISFLFLQKIARKLKAKKIIRAKQGKSGGYVLAQKFDKINLKEIFEALEGPCSVIECASRPCPLAGKCATRGVLGKLNTKINKVLQEIKLSDF